jgi:molybdopterin synthase catalytic subunit
MLPYHFVLTDQPIIQPNDALADKQAGAMVLFEGRVRCLNEGRTVTALEYEAYPSMAVKEGQTIIDELTNRYDVLGMSVIHRTGLLAIGDIALWVSVISMHRKEAFQVTSELVDQIKMRVPIWKKEHYTNEPARWVACHQCTSGLNV